MLWCTYPLRHDLADKIDKNYSWWFERVLALLITNTTSTMLKEGVVIEKKELNISIHYWLSFIINNLIPSQNESILWHRKATLMGCIMDRSLLNFSSTITIKILIRAKQHQTSLSIPGLIMALYRRASVPFVKKIDVEITPSASSNIWRIDSEFQKDKEESARRKLVNTSPTINVE